MIGLSELFSMIGQNDYCQDVATSLVMQGCDPEISIPIYEIFYLKLLPGEHTGFLANSIPEYNAIRKLASTCGSVAATVNLLDMDILTLVGLVAIYTPNSGMNIFMKLGDVATGQLEADVIKALSELSGIPIPDNVMQSAEGLCELADEIIQTLFDTLLDSIAEDLDNYGIQLREWDELPMFYSQLRQSGEERQMCIFRQQVGAQIL